MFVCPGCYRDPSWPLWRQPLPAYTMLFLVPIYSFLATMANLQSYRSRHAPVMVSSISALCFLARCHLSFIAPCSPVELTLGHLSFVQSFVFRDWTMANVFIFLESDGIRLAELFYLIVVLYPAVRILTHSNPQYSSFTRLVVVRHPPRAVRLCSRALRILRTKARL